MDGVRSVMLLEIEVQLLLYAFVCYCGYLMQNDLKNLPPATTYTL